MRNRGILRLSGSILDTLRWRFREDGVGGVTGGGSTGSSAQADVEPVNGGPDRDFASMANATVEEPVNQPQNPNNSVTTGQVRTPADPNQRANGPAAASEWQSIREAAAAQGYQFDATVTDDRTALNFLLAQANRNRQADVYSQLGRQLAPHSGQIQNYLQQQTRPQQAQPDRQPWEAPEFDERWGALVDRNEATGLFVAKPGVDPAIAQKVNEYVQWKSNYDRNPGAVLNGMVETRAKAIAAETFREQFAAQQRESTIGAIVNENARWMYQVDQGGQRLRDYQGQYIPTPVGAAYIQQLRTVQQMGVTDPRQQDALAKQLVRGQYAQASQAQVWAAQQQQVNPQTSHAVAQPNVNALQSAPPSTRRANPAATEPDKTGLSLSERIRQALAAEGVTDSDVFNSSE